MSLRERIHADVNRIFENLQHFAEVHYWNGAEITCVPDEEEALKRKNNNVNDISWDNNMRTILIHVAAEGFPGGEPEPNTQITFDLKPMKVLDVAHNMGMYDILLTVADPRRIMG